PFVAAIARPLALDTSGRSIVMPAGKRESGTQFARRAAPDGARCRRATSRTDLNARARVSVADVRDPVCVDAAERPCPALRVELDDVRRRLWTVALLGELHRARQRLDREAGEERPGDLRPVRRSRMLDRRDDGRGEVVAAGRIRIVEDGAVPLPESS